MGLGCYMVLLLSQPKIAAASPLLQSLAGVWMAQAFPSTPPATSWVATATDIYSAW